MSTIKQRQHGIALLVLMLLVGNTTVTCWAKSLCTVTEWSLEQPQRKAPPPGKVIPVPADWITIEDEEIGYSFEAPKGTEHAVEKKDNFVLITAAPPAPIAAKVILLAFKNRKDTKETLLKFAMGWLKGLQVKTITPGELVEVSQEYSVADFTATVPGGAVKGKALVATGVNDSYVMMVVVDEAKFKANEEVMDEIWGSFSILPAGAHISELTLGKDKAMRQPAEEFTTTETIYAAVKISKNEGTVKVKGRLHVVEIPGQKAGPIPGIEMIVTVTGESQNTANFQFSKPTKGWPLGKYKFEALLIDASGKTIGTESHEFIVN